MNERLCMNSFDMKNKLNCQQKLCLHDEFVIIKVEQIFQTETQMINNHCKVIAFNFESMNKKNSDDIDKNHVHLSFMFKLRILSLSVFKFDEKLLSEDNIDV